jgi:hypothetical protein
VSETIGISRLFGAENIGNDRKSDKSYVNEAFKAFDQPDRLCPLADKVLQLSTRKFNSEFCLLLFPVYESSIYICCMKDCILRIIISSKSIAYDSKRVLAGLMNSNEQRSGAQ